MEFFKITLCVVIASLAIPRVSEAHPYVDTCITLLKRWKNPQNGYPQLDRYQYEGTTYRRTTDPDVLRTGTLIEGLPIPGGFEPHFRVDLEHEGVKVLLGEAMKATKGLSETDKTSWVLRAVRKNVKMGKFYSPRYESERATRLFERKPLPTEFAADCESGFCTEASVLTKAFLDAVGVKNKIKHVKFWTRLDSGELQTEERVFVLTLEDTKWRILDSDPAGVLRGRTLNDLQSPGGVPGVAGNAGETRFGISEVIAKTYAIPQKEVPNSAFEMPLSNGNTQRFQIKGRSKSEKDFATEKEIIEAANPDDFVPIEFIFSPLYFAGHSVLRYGESLLEFSQSEWKILDTGSANARAYLFNNPNLKKIAKQDYAREKAPTFTLGLPLQIKKKDIEEWIAFIRKDQRNDERRRFSFLKNNCNHNLVWTLKEKCAVFPEDLDGLDMFSSMLTFKKLMIQAGQRAETVNVYPIWGSEIYSVKERLPDYLDAEHPRFTEYLRYTKTFVREKFQTLKLRLENLRTASPVRSIP